MALGTTKPAEPVPRAAESTQLAWSPQVLAERPLRGGAAGPLTEFGAVLDQRRCAREMAAVGPDELARFLWHSSRTRAAHERSEHRAAPSAGAVHGVHLLVLVPSVAGIALYDPLRHALLLLESADHLLKDGIEHARRVLPKADGALLCFAAEPGRYEAHYAAAESLLWRDAGCLIATQGLVAAWLGLAFCPLGILGTEIVASVDPDNRLVAAGTVALGRSSER